MISLLNVKSITILLKTTLQNRNKHLHIHLCFYQVEGGFLRGKYSTTSASVLTSKLLKFDIKIYILGFDK